MGLVKISVNFYISITHSKLFCFCLRCLLNGDDTIARRYFVAQRKLYTSKRMFSSNEKKM